MSRRRAELEGLGAQPTAKEEDECFWQRARGTVGSSLEHLLLCRAGERKLYPVVPPPPPLPPLCCPSPLLPSVSLSPQPPSPRPT